MNQAKTTQQTTSKVETPTNQLPAVIAQRGVDAATYNTLKKVLFPEAKSDEIIAVALDYCKARGLDILKKPVHIVPMWDSRANGGKGAMVDQIWPGIYEFRATAAKTGFYAGIKKAKYGKLITKTFKSTKSKDRPNDITVSYPEDCTITVYRLVQGVKCAFEGTARWEESVVLNSGQPNSIWKKRTHSQLAKCAEAEALRKAFPDELGGIMTSEEMEGREIRNDVQTLDIEPEEKKMSGFDARVMADDKPNAKTIDIEPEEPRSELEEIGDEELEWDGKTIFTGKGNSTELNNANHKTAVAYLTKIMLNHKTKEARLDLITRNTGLTRSLIAAGEKDLAASLHEIANKGQE